MKTSLLFFLLQSTFLGALCHPHGFTTIWACNNVRFLLKEKNQHEFVLTLDHGVVVNEGAIVTAEGKILRNTETYTKDQLQLMKPNRNIAKENPFFFNGRLAVISSPGQENWYHWLLQVLPRLKILTESGVVYDKIYIDNLKFPWQFSSLELALQLLHIPKEKLFLPQGDSVTEAKKLIVPSVGHIPSKGKSFPPWLKTFLHKCFLPSKPLKKNFRKIYISRSKASLRRILNEKEVTQFLTNKGFQILHLEELSPREQAVIFHQAKIIVGPHGSGFANLIFSKVNTKVVEIDHGLPGREQRSYYKHMAKEMNCRYFPLYTDLVTEEDLEKDITVNMRSFKRLICRLTCK